MAAPPAPHRVPPANWECKATFDPISLEEGNYVEYQTMPSGTWQPAGFSKETVMHLINTGFAKYTSDVEKASKDCAAAVRRIVAKGPPEFLQDPVALPLPEGDTHVSRVWFCDENKEISARLLGSPEGVAREALWNAQKEALAAMEAAEAASGGT